MNVESPTRVVEYLTPAPHLPPFTVADVIVTPDPFRDVIRTEPAPDLISLMGDILPIFKEQTTTTVSSRPAQTSLVTSLTTVTGNLTTTSQRNKIKHPEEDDTEVKEGEQADDEFSFDSVFSYLFDSDKWTSASTEKPESNTVHPLYPTKDHTINLTAGELTNKPLAPERHFVKQAQQPLEHRSDADVENNTSDMAGKIQLVDTIAPNNNFEQNKISTNIATGTKLKHVITLKPVNQIVSVTTMKSKTSTKRFGNKHPTTYSRPFPTKPTAPSSGLLKLAGCNIYGRMYRVGRIITELSSPCLECMCTEIGVQCRPLKC